MFVVVNSVFEELLDLDDLSPQVRQKWFGRNMPNWTKAAETDCGIPPDLWTRSARSRKYHKEGSSSRDTVSWSAATLPSLWLFSRWAITLKAKTLASAQALHTSFIQHFFNNIGTIVFYFNIMAAPFVTSTYNVTLEKTFKALAFHNGLIKTHDICINIPNGAQLLTGAGKDSSW